MQAPVANRLRQTVEGLTGRSSLKPWEIAANGQQVLDPLARPHDSPFVCRMLRGAGRKSGGGASDALLC